MWAEEEEAEGLPAITRVSVLAFQSLRLRHREQIRGMQMGKEHSPQKTFRTLARS